MKQDYTPEEIDRRRDEVVRVMLATPPKPRKKSKSVSASAGSADASPPA